MKAIFPFLSLLVVLSVPFALRAADNQPWVVTLDVEKGISYFDSSGRQLSRSKLNSPSRIEECVAIELGDFIPDDGWLELILLRNTFWFETFLLPRPGEKSVKRIDYYRYQPVNGQEPRDLSLVNYPKDPSKLAMLVPGRKSGGKELGQLFLYEILNTGDRSQVQIMSIETDWDGIPGEILLATLGLNCTYVNLAALTKENGLWLGHLDRMGSVKWLARGIPVPENFEPWSLRLVADRIYLMDTKNRIQTWILKGNELKTEGRPVRLELPVDILSFTPLNRQAVPRN